uniref:Phosphate transporter n=1 Tax=Dermatophagoides pteronyssinus TaxID=6956 RepID=A0A6P6Y9Y0_DERPT|nr:sodium-dependent phosphate transporter 1-A-like [Dermatophagoides pteronyssinus]
MYVTMQNVMNSALSSITSTTTIDPIESLSAMDQHATLWILIVSFILAFFLAFGIGANDVANSFGTSVGSKVLTQKQACILATIFEISGALLLGYKVSSTIRVGMIYVDMYDDTKILMAGYLAALFGSALWNLVATLFGLPVSGTHSIVGSMIGFSIVGQGFASVRWQELIRIVASWFISPIMSGLISMSLYLFIRWYIINREEPLKNGLKMLPVFYGFTIFINIFSIVHNGPLFLKYITWWIALIMACVVGTVVGLLVRIWIVPRLRNKILEIKANLTHTAIQITHLDHHHHHNHQKNKENPVDLLKLTPIVCNNIDNGDNICSTNIAIINNSNNNNNNNNSNRKQSTMDIEMSNEKNKDLQLIDVDDDKPEVAKIFTFLHILTACFSSFAHGANDTSNAIGPLVAVMMLYQTGTQTDESPWYLLLFGGVGMSVGLWVWGRRVIQTMGKDLTKITPSTGFVAEIGAASTVLLASKIGLPVSTTHCQVGSVVFVGKAMNSQKGVNWKLFINIAISWALTVPLSALFSAAAMWLLKFVV